MGGPLLFLIGLTSKPVHLFGGGPGLPTPWSDPEVEALVASSSEYWNEVPKIGPEGAELARTYGIDAERPLATWLTPAEHDRVQAAASAHGVPSEMLAPLRPWLAAQIVKIAMEQRAGMHAEYAAEVHLAGVAERHGVPMHSEFGSPEAVFATFSGWPREAEVDRLMSIVAEAERGPAWHERQAKAWRSGDMAHLEGIDREWRLDYPAFYEHLVVRRNRAWVERISEMLSQGRRAFVVCGSAHLAGDDGVSVLLERAGIACSRLN